MLILLASSRSSAENAAKCLRREGFLADASIHGEKPLVLVNCVRADQDEVVRRVRLADPLAKPVICGLVASASGGRSIPTVSWTGYSQLTPRED